MTQNKSPAPPQGSVLLRLLAGGYLVYLAWQLFQGADGDWKLLLAAGIFAVVGTALAVWNGWTLIRSDYFRNTPPRETLPEEADPEETDPEV